MSEVEITGGAGPFEAAAVTAAVGHVLEAEKTAAARRPPSNLPPAWMRAGRPRNPDDPLDVIVPDHRGDPL
ncbi:hypothetical protein BH23ACT5_BH23ACT5_21950 [soil metagenome]